MICPDCGRDVPEGLMYCDSCGREFHMVPAFEPEIENQINKTMSGLIKKIEGKTEDERPVRESTRVKKAAKAENINEGGKKKKAGSRRRPSVRGPLMLSAVMAVLAIIMIVAALNDTDEGGSSSANNEAHAGILIDKVKDTINAVTQLIPDAPGITPESGSFEDSVEITLSLYGNGTIYYTLNGEEPDTQSMRYDAPILLSESGTYRLQAISVSGDGFKSGVASADYQVKEKKVEPPRILEESGHYSKQTKIVAVADPDVSIYYTTGTDEEPDENSSKYTEPVNMPLGSSVYNFIAVDEKGRKSEVVTREYVLELPKNVSEEQAVASVIQSLMEIGVLTDASGIQPGIEERLSFAVEDTVLIGNDGEFYFIREYATDAAGVTEPTGLLYAVNTMTGMTRRLGYDSYSNMMLMPFQ